MKTVIMAGGKGTRLGSLATDVPKPLVEVEGKPILEREIECLRDQGFCEVILTVSYMADRIMGYFGNGSAFGVKIDYYHEEKPLGNAGALFELRDSLTEDFLLINADIVFSVDLQRMVHFHRDKNALATLFTHPNDHPYDSGLIVAGNDHVIKKWISKEESHPKWYRNRVNAGIHILNPEVFDRAEVVGALKGKSRYEKERKVDLDRDVLRPLCESGRMLCYDSPEYVKDVGTPGRLVTVGRDILQGRVEDRCLKKRQKAFFLDRDGTINRYKGFLKNIEEFELLPDVTEAIRMINASGYLAVVVTNQPVIARGEVCREELDEIHRKMETLLGQDGAYLNAIYVCPHHPDKGFEGEIPELKVDCECRKPKPGMLFKAEEDYNIDLGESWMIGDQSSDVMAGKAAGCHTALIGEGEYGQEISGQSLFDIMKQILKSE